MQKERIRELFLILLNLDIDNKKIKKFVFRDSFEKKILKLKGKESYSVFKKIAEVIQSDDLSHYKNLKYSLKKYKRVHVNSSYVILFYDDITKMIYFDSYEHHDNIYRK